MQTLENVEQQWQTSVVESIINMVKAEDGDFDAIAKLSQAVSDVSSLNKIIDFLCSHPQGKRAFDERPRIGNVDLQLLHQLPENTLGYAYANHMITNNLTPLQSNFSDSNYQFLAAHLAETHDIWHIITGCDTNITGEIKLEAFYVAQLYASRFWLALLAKNLLKAVLFDIEVSSKYMDAITEGWLMAKQAKPLFGIQWNTLWETPLEDVRNSLAINNYSKIIVG
ncbi:MAG TPA: Coq4 family protein [Oculatellaceae cyanobacterium]|jgi:ubiquinone biosynthesis protein Coq4